METTIKLFAAEITLKALLQRMLLGAVIGFLIISLFVFNVNHPKPDWPVNWRIRPLIVTPLAGAFGILSFYLKDLAGVRGNWAKIFVIILSTLCFIISLWLGTVLGLAGTMWN